MSIEATSIHVLLENLIIDQKVGIVQNGSGQGAFKKFNDIVKKRL